MMEDKATCVLDELIAQCILEKVTSVSGEV